MLIRTKQLNAGILAASAAGRALMADNFFDSSTAGAKFEASSIALAKLAEAVLQADGGQALTGDLPAGSNKITGLAAATTNGDAVRYEQGILADGTNAFSADQSMGSNKLTNLAAPTADADAARKVDVDRAQEGLDAKDSVALATDTALAANTQAGTGVGATLTADANGALTVDGVAVASADRILVKDETSAPNCGIYTVTQTGDGSNPFILTRAADADGDQDNVTGGMFCFVEKGSTNADTGWVLTTNGVVSVDSDDQNFTQFFGAASVNYEDADPTQIGADSAAAPGSNMTAARGDHQHAIATGAPDSTLDGASSNAPGTSNNLARADHVHALDVGAVADVIQPDDVAAEGTDDTLARAEHKHAIFCAAPTATLDAASTNTEGAGTSFARNDHTHALDVGAAGSTVDPDVAAAPGTDDTLARADHVHDIGVAAPSSTLDGASSNAEGSSSNLARADHVHALDVGAAPSNPAATPVEGTDDTIARADHQHARDVEAQENITTEEITGSDTALSMTLGSTPTVAGSVQLWLNGVFQVQGAGKDYTVSGTTITWLASSGTAVDMDTSDVLVARYSRAYA